MTRSTRFRRVDFHRVAGEALAAAPAIVARWCPNGRREGREWVAFNPTRGDKHLGSFKISLATGRWSDFAEGRSGGDLISLAAYLFNLSMRDAAISVAEMLRIDPYEH